ncbi:MAG: ribosome silencing factor [Pseudomonadota bacterium]|nr:ribosome silencing factor [Pseudomonadota bacterium]
MNPQQLADLVTTALADIKAFDIEVLDVHEMTGITDFMVIASGRSNRQVKAMAGKVVDAARAAGIKPLGIEGEGQAEWVLVDLGDVVVHAMQPATRDFYQLEKLWSPVEESRKPLSGTHPAVS